MNIEKTTKSQILKLRHHVIKTFSVIGKKWDFVNVFFISYSIFTK